jgi:hypothetical protein
MNATFPTDLAQLAGMDRQRLARRAIMLALLVFLFAQGIPYGLNGDPQRYAKTLNGYVQERSVSRAGFFDVIRRYGGREPLFWYLSGHVIPTFLRRPFTPLEITLMSALFVLLSFRLLLTSIRQAIVAFAVFASTMQGFLVTFNLYRTALAMFVFAFSVAILRSCWRRRPESRMLLAIASLAAAAVQSIYVIQVAAVVRLPKRNLALLLYATVVVLTCGLILSGTVLGTQVEYFWNRFQWESETWRMPVASPVLIGLVLLAFLFRMRPIPDPDGFVGPLGVLLLLLVTSMALGFSLAYERLYILLTFLFVVFAIRSSFASRRETVAFVILNVTNLVLQLYRMGHLAIPRLT